MRAVKRLCSDVKEDKISDDAITTEVFSSPSEVQAPVPFAAPYFFIASNAYAEHVGVNLQHEGNKGEIQI